MMWPFRCRGCDNDPHTFRLGRLHWFVYRNGYAISQGRSRRVVRIAWWFGQEPPLHSRELWPGRSRR